MRARVSAAMIAISIAASSSADPLTAPSIALDEDGFRINGRGIATKAVAVDVTAILGEVEAVYGMYIYYDLGIYFTVVGKDFDFTSLGNNPIPVDEPPINVFSLLLRPGERLQLMHGGGRSSWGRNNPKTFVGTVRLANTEITPSTPRRELDQVLKNLGFVSGDEPGLEGFTIYRGRISGKEVAAAVDANGLAELTISLTGEKGASLRQLLSAVAKSTPETQQLFKSRPPCTSFEITLLLHESGEITSSETYFLGTGASMNPDSIVAVRARASQVRESLTKDNPLAILRFPSRCD